MKTIKDNFGALYFINVIISLLYFSGNTFGHGKRSLIEFHIPLLTIYCVQGIVPNVMENTKTKYKKL